MSNAFFHSNGELLLNVAHNKADLHNFLANKMHSLTLKYGTVSSKV